jgi:hypothetical protein
MDTREFGKEVVELGSAGDNPPVSIAAGLGMAERPTNAENSFNKLYFAATTVPSIKDDFQIAPHGDDSFTGFVNYVVPGVVTQHLSQPTQAARR